MHLFRATVESALPEGQTQTVANSERKDSSESSSSSSADERKEEEKNGESKVDRLLREAIDVLKESGGTTDILADSSTPRTGASSPAQFSHASDEASNIDFFGELREKISHMRNRDEVILMLIVTF